MFRRQKKSNSNSAQDRPSSDTEEYGLQRKTLNESNDGDGVQQLGNNRHESCGVNVEEK